MSAFDPQSLLPLLTACAPVGRVWAAYSGGLDSTALLRALAAVRERLPGPLSAVHIDHGLHPDSSAWAEHCHATCEGLAIPFLARRLDLKPAPGESLEARAREARYGAFATLLAPGDVLLTAHTQDDQAEPLLLALIRGSGVHGLAAMPVTADLGLGRLVRPLLQCSRADLEGYANTLGLTWLTDPSNAELTMDRNYLRNLVMPLMRERWPAVAATLSRSAAHCAEAAEVVDLVAGRELPTLGGERPGTLAITALGRLAPVVRKAVLRLWLRRRGFRVPSTAHLGRILTEVLPARSDAAPLVAWAGCEVRRYRTDLFALRPLPAPPLGLDLAWEGARLELPDGLGALVRDPGEGEAGVTADRPTSWRVRFGITEQGCRLHAGGPHRPLKKIYQEAGVPPWLRPYVPLVFDGEDLVAVAGVCSCEPGAEDSRSGAVTEEQEPGVTATAVEVRWSGHPWESLGFFALPQC
jgi:tRNA(Ile)-lysidine synthase